MLQYPEIGQIVGGKYRTLRLLGQGGMGIVLEAENVATGKRVALKWMHPEVSADPVAAERLLREAQVAARVRHPNVIDIYDVDRHEGALFLVMEYLEGESLRALLARGGTPPAELVALLLGAMRGVAAAHRRGIVHRDIKPENIFLAARDGGAPTPKLLDFGISKLAMLEPHQSPLTKTGMAFGTPVYTCYEQLCGAHDLDATADVYSFGVILYESFTGHLPYEADNFAGMIAKIVTAPPVPMRKHRPQLPSALDRIVLAALCREREQRIQSVELLMHALEPFVTEPALRAALGPPLPAPATVDEASSSHSRSATAASAFPAALQRQRYRRSLIAVAVGAIVVASAAVVLKWADALPSDVPRGETTSTQAVTPPLPGAQAPSTTRPGTVAQVATPLLSPEPPVAPTSVVPAAPVLGAAPLAPLAPLDAGRQALTRRAVPQGEARSTAPTPGGAATPAPSSASRSAPATPASGPRRRVPTPHLDEF